MKSKAEKSKDQAIWNQYKNTRNEANNAIKQSKCKYFKTNLEQTKSDPKKTWKLINDLNARQVKQTKISEIKMGDRIADTPADIAEAFDNHFVKVGENLASKITTTNTYPISYLNSPNSTYCFDTIDVHEVCYFLNKINTKKAVGLDNLPCILLKIAANVCVTIFNAYI